MNPDVEAEWRRTLLDNLRILVAPKPGWLLYKDWWARTAGDGTIVLCQKATEDEIARWKAVDLIHASLTALR